MAIHCMPCNLNEIMNSLIFPTGGWFFQGWSQNLGVGLIGWKSLLNLPRFQHIQHFQTQDKVLTFIVARICNITETIFKSRKLRFFGILNFFEHPESTVIKKIKELSHAGMYYVRILLGFSSVLGRRLNSLRC
jgi:hypothetical protein